MKEIEIGLNEKYPGQFWILKDSLKETPFNALLYVSGEGKIDIEISYPDFLVENVELTNFLNSSDELFDVQGRVMVGHVMYNVSLFCCSTININSHFFVKSRDKSMFHQYLKIRAAAYVLGVLVDSKTRIVRGEFKFSALSHWCDGLQCKESGGEICLQAHNQYSTKTKNGDELILHNDYEKKNMGQRVLFEQTGSLEIKFSQSCVFEEVLDYGRIYNDFFALITNQKSNIMEEYIYFESDQNKYKLVTEDQMFCATPSEQVGFSFKSLTNNMSILHDWYDSYKNTNLAYALFFDSYHNRERYKLDVLIDTYVRSFEGMITRHYREKKLFMSRNANKQIIDKIKKSIEPCLDAILTIGMKYSGDMPDYMSKYKQTILSGLAHVYELSLRNRIDYFLDLHSKYFEHDFKKYDKDKIIKEIIKFRNAYAHADDSKMSNEDIFILCRFLKKMILVHLFSDVLKIDDFKIELADIY